MSPYTHPDWELLLRAVCAAPDDDLPRLVAADWLDEHGEPERAEFIRIQIERERADRPDLKWREKALLDNPLFGALWAQEACPSLVHLELGSQVRSIAVSGSERVRFRRGFPDRITCPAGDWQRHGARVVPRQPVRELRLTKCDAVPFDQWWEILEVLRPVPVVSLDTRSVILPGLLRERLEGVEVRVNGKPAPLLIADALPDLQPLIRELPRLGGGFQSDPSRLGDTG